MAIRCPKRPPRRLQMAPRRPKRPSRGLQDPPRSIFPLNMDPLNLKKPSKSIGKIVVLSLYTNVASDFHANLVPFRLQLSPKSPPRCLQDALGRPSKVPKRAQEPPKRRPRCAKNRPRAAPEASWKRPLGALGRRHAAKHPQTPSRPRFWTILATIWKEFGIILDRFLGRRNVQIDR